MLNPIFHSKRLKSSIFLSGIALLMTSLTACGENPTLVKQIQITSSGSGTSAEVSMLSELELNGFQMGSFQLPIFDPRTGIHYGTLGTRPLDQGLVEVSISVQIGELISRQASLEPAKLPNGNALPVSSGQNSIWMLNAGNNSKIYLGAFTNQTVFGFAIVIPEFDGISRNIPIPLNFFPVIPMQPDLNLAAGIFTSQAPLSSGIAVVADYKKGLVIDIPSPSLMAMRVAKNQNSVQLKSQSPNDQQKKELGSKLKKLRNKKRNLTIQ